MDDIQHILPTYPYNNTPRTVNNHWVSKKSMRFDPMLERRKITAIAMSLNQDQNIIFVYLFKQILNLRITMAWIRVQQCTSVPGKDTKTVKKLPKGTTPTIEKYQCVGSLGQATHPHEQKEFPAGCQVALPHLVPPECGVDRS